MTEVLERERKWEVDDDFVLPSLDDIAPGGEVGTAASGMKVPASAMPSIANSSSSTASHISYQ